MWQERLSSGGRCAPDAAAGLQSPKVWPVLLVAVAAGVVWWPYQLTLPKPVWVVLDVLLVVAVLGTAFVIRKAEPGEA